jgi:hypothetical protein
MEPAGGSRVSKSSHGSCLGLTRRSKTRDVILPRLPSSVRIVAGSGNLRHQLTRLADKAKLSTRIRPGNTAYRPSCQPCRQGLCHSRRRSIRSDPFFPFSAGMITCWRPRGVSVVAAVRMLSLLPQGLPAPRDRGKSTAGLDKRGRPFMLSSF